MAAAEITESVLSDHCGLSDRHLPDQRERRRAGDLGAQRGVIIGQLISRGGLPRL
jgi:hypothetical protein